MTFANLASMHRSIAERYGPRTAVRHRQFGMYHDLTWFDVRRQADGAAAGLLELGAEKGDRIALLSENRYEWIIADQAILSLGCIDVPLHAPLAARQVEYQVGHSEARGIIVSGQSQADKVYEVLDSLPNLEFIISFDPVSPPPKPLVCRSWPGLMHRGWKAGRGDGILARESKTARDDLATILYTSGTTGNPKGVMLTHGNLLSNTEATLETTKMEPDDILLSWLPYSHIYARTVDLYVIMLAAATIALADSIDTLVVNLAEIQPTWFTAVPRFYEKVWTKVENLPPDERADVLHRIFGPRLKQLSSGGAPLPRHVCEGFFEAGIPLLEGYGLTETSPVISFNRLDDYRIGSVGRAIPDVDVKIAEDGEILCRGPNVMKGYWKDPEATAEAIRDGWFHTGDVGHLDDDGYLTITDRKKDLFVTSSGKNIAPSELERLLVSDVYIDQAVVYGDGRKFISAVIVPNFEKLEAKAREMGCGLDAEDGFIASPHLLDFMQGRVDAVMQSVSNPERVKKLLLLDRPFQIEDNELTATLKVRRAHIIAKYEDRLAELYEEERSQPSAISDQPD